MTNPLDDPQILEIAERGSIDDREFNKFTKDRAMTDPEPVHVVGVPGEAIVIEGQALNPDEVPTTDRASGVHSANSTSANLGVGATFTGEYFDLSDYSGVIVSVNCNENGSVLIDNSHDGITIDRTSTFATTGGTHFSIGLTKLTRYMRLRFTNGGASTTTTCRVQFIPQTEALSPVLQRVDAPFSGASIAQNTRNVLLAEDDATNWDAITRGDLGGLRVAVREHESDTPIRPGDDWLVTRGTIDVTAANVLPAASALADRISLEIYNSDGTKNLRASNSVARLTAGHYRTIAPGQGIILELDETNDLALQAASGTIAYEIIEVADTSL